MKVTYGNQTYDCAKAVRDGDRATLYLSQGGMTEFVGVSETTWEKFVMEDGAWETVAPAVSDADRLDALEAAMLAIMMEEANHV